MSVRPGGGYVGRPSHGLRLEVVRDDDAGAEGRWVYRGHVHLKEASIALEVVATAEMADVALDARAGLDALDREFLTKQLAALVRAATRAEVSAGEAPPKKIARWRAWASRAS